jgi:metal-responsive CopG/Arc/MetJ family transcriptional regulator
MGSTAKLTITLPKDLIVLADRLAKAKKVSRSKIISACLQELAIKQKEAEMAEGYLRLAEEQKQFVTMAAKTIPEVLPEWK